MPAAGISTTSSASVNPEHDLAHFPAGLRGKRILLCTESFGPVNGVSRTTLMLVNHLTANGAQVAVVAPENRSRDLHFTPGGDTTAKDTSQDHRPQVLRVGGWPVPYNPELSVAYLVRISSLFRRTFGSPPDLIYLASPASLGFQVMLQMRQQRPAEQIPIICNFQTDLAGYCSVMFPGAMGDLAVRAFGMVQSFLFRHESVRTVFYPSTFVRRYLGRCGVQDTKMELLTRGVDTELFNPSKRSHDICRRLAPNGQIILICVARLGPEKGFDFLAKAAQALDARGLDFKLCIVGGTRNAGVEESIKNSFATLVEKDKVVFLGFKIGEALAEAYANADLFLHCSVTETFGLVVLESMASGVPVIARDEGGPSDTIKHGVSGLLVPPSDLDMFVEKVMLLSKNKSLREMYRKNAREQACDATWEKINNKVAWRMFDTIEQQRQDELQRMKASRSSFPTQSTIPVFGWMFLNQALSARIVESKLMVALGVILSFWAAVSVYLIFIEVKQWVRAKLWGSAGT